MSDSTSFDKKESVIENKTNSARIYEVNNKPIKTNNNINTPTAIKKKSVNVFTIFDKENQWVVCDGKDIVWLMNERTDNRYRVTELTRKVIIIKKDSK